MFWWKKAKQAPAEEPAPSRISDEDAFELADHALDSVAGLLRVFGEKSFDTDGPTAEQTLEVCEKWARHILVGTPAHPSHELVKTTADAGDSEPRPIERDFINLMRFFSSHRGLEQGYVTQSLADLRMVIWSMVQGLRGSITSDRGSDRLAADQLRRLGTAVEGRSAEKIRREARECIQLISSLIEEREVRQKKQIEALASRLQEMRSELELAWAETSRDPLTGLGNRTAFDQQIERVVNVGFLFSETAYLFMIDVDHFKWVNDNYGHPAGDEVLRRVSDCLRASFLRTNDFIARYGGEEFAVLLRVERRELALQLAERVSFAVRDAAVERGGDEIRVTISIGVAELAAGEDSASWLARADAALYAAKNAGRDRAVFAPPPSATEDDAADR